MPRRTLPSYKSSYFRRLNELHLTVQVTVAALEERQAALSAGSAASRRAQHFQVPSGGRPNARIRREGKDVDRLIDRAIQRTQYEQALVIAVSIIEDYLANLIRLMLRAHPSRLVRGVIGGELRPVPFKDFLTKDREAILEDWIEARIASVFYRRPAEYLEYVAQVIGIEMDPTLASRYAEIKATRDIVVHADGRANQIYVEKSGDLSRSNAGETLRIDRAYFDSVIGTLKALIGGLQDALSASYPDDEKVSLWSSRLLS